MFAPWEVRHPGKNIWRWWWLIGRMVVRMVFVGDDYDSMVIYFLYRRRIWVVGLRRLPTAAFFASSVAVGSLAEVLFLFSLFSLFTFTILILHFVFSHPLPWGVFRWYLVIEKQRWCGRRFAATILLSPVNCWRLDGAPDRIIHQPSFWMAAAPFSSVAVVIAHSGKMSTSRPPWEIRYSLRRIAHDGGLALLFVFCVSEDDGVVALFVFGVMVRS